MLFWIRSSTYKAAVTRDLKVVESWAWNRKTYLIDLSNFYVIIFLRETFIFWDNWVIVALYVLINTVGPLSSRPQVIIPYLGYAAYT